MIFKRKDSKHNNKINPINLAVDIGTEYVKSVVYIIEEGVINVIGYNRTRQKENSMYAAFIINLKDVSDAVDKSLGESISMARKNYVEHFIIPKEIILGIAGELVQGVSIVVNVDRDKPNQAITSKELENVIKRVKTQTFQNTKEEIAEQIGLKGSQVEEINTYINSTYIDGIRVSNPIGFTGNELIYKVFSTFAPKIHLESLNQIANNLNLKIKHIVVEPYALTLGLKNMRNLDSNAIIIDIGGGTTDLALVENGDIVGTKMFAIGGKVFTKRIQKELNIEWEEAQDLKLKYTNNTLSKDLATQFATFFTKDIQTWLTGVEIALEEFEDVKEYPPYIYLCGGGALLPDIQEGLITYPWTQSLNFKKFPKVNFIFPNSINDVIDRTKSAILPMDVTPLALARMELEI